MDHRRIRKRAGFLWRLRADAPPGLIDRMLELRQGAMPEVRIVKRNPVRTVFELEVCGERFYAKWHRFRGIRDAVLSLLRRTRAKREWRTALALERLGIRAVEPVLLGWRRRFGVPVESFLVTRGVNGTSLKGLAQRLAAAGAVISPGERQIIEHLGALVRLLHANGVHHPDLHGDNILITEPHHQLCLLDLHAAKLRAGISRRDRVQNLAVLCNSLALSGVTRQDRLRFVKAYLGPDSTRAKVLELSEVVRAKSQRLRARRVKSRSRRCVVRSSVFTNERTRLGRVYRRRAMSPEQVLHAVRLHQRVMAGDAVGTVLKRSPKTNVTLIEGDGSLDARRLCVKEFVRRGMLRLLPARLRHQPAMVSWKVALGLAVRGVSAVEAHAMVLGKGASSYLIMPAVQSATPLIEYIENGLGSHVAVSRRRKFIRAAAEFLLGCYAAGVLHRDLKASNVLVRETDTAGWEFILLDLAAVRFPRRIPVGRKLLNLAQLNASTPIRFSWTDRLRLLRLLGAAEPALAGRPAMAKIARMTRGRICTWSE